MLTTSSSGCEGGCVRPVTRIRNHKPNYSLEASKGPSPSKSSCSPAPFCAAKLHSALRSFHFAERRKEPLQRRQPNKQELGENVRRDPRGLLLLNRSVVPQHDPTVVPSIRSKQLDAELASREEEVEDACDRVEVESECLGVDGGEEDEEGREGVEEEEEEQRGGRSSEALVGPALKDEGEGLCRGGAKLF